MVQFRTPTDSQSIPAELTSRLNQVKEHQSLRDQRNTFSLPQLHGKTRCRWSSHLLEFPYFHIVDVAEDEIKVHVLLFKHRKVLTLSRKNQAWNFKELRAEECVYQVVPKYCLHTGHLFKSASKAKVELVAQTLNIKPRKIPPLTDANANLIIKSKYIHSDLKVIRKLAEEHTTKLDKAVTKLTTTI